MKQNRPVPHWIRLRTDNTIRYAFYLGKAALSNDPVFNVVITASAATGDALS